MVGAHDRLRSTPEIAPVGERASDQLVVLEHTAMRRSEQGDALVDLGARQYLSPLDGVTMSLAECEDCLVGLLIEHDADAVVRVQTEI